MSRAVVLWMDEILESKLKLPMQVLSTLKKVSLAVDFASDSSLDALQFADKAMGSYAVARKSVWLRGWDGDAASVACLASLPFQGGKLFVKALEPHLVEGKDKKMVLPPSKKESAKRQQTFCSQGFA